MANAKNTEEIVAAFLAVFRELKKKLTYNNPLFHLPLAQMEMLRFTQEKKRVAMKEISDHLGITPPSATVLVNQLVSLNYIHRTTDSKDRRSIFVTLTKTGTTVLAKTSKLHCQRIAKLLDKLNQKEKDEFLHLLTKMIN